MRRWRAGSQDSPPTGAPALTSAQAMLSSRNPLGKVRQVTRYFPKTELENRMTITLKTLPEATPQQVFDQVARHLMTQNRKSICAYRSEFINLSCAAGCLIADDEYMPSMEGSLWIDLVNRKAVPDTHHLLITELQTVHDKHKTRFWARQLKLTAEEKGLDSSVVTKLEMERAS